MKVFVDRDQCICCGVCWAECPELFAEDAGDGKTSVAEKYRVSGSLSQGDAPESLRASAEAAANGCPVSIIRVE